MNGEVTQSLTRIQGGRLFHRPGRCPGLPGLGGRRTERGAHRPDRPLLFVHGPPAELLAWLLGRGSGAGLQVSGGARAAAGRRGVRAGPVAVAGRRPAPWPAAKEWGVAQQRTDSRAKENL